MKCTLIFLISVSLLYAKAQTVNIKTVKGDFMKGNKTINNVQVTKNIKQTYIYNNVTDSNRNKVLLLNKYIDTTKKNLDKSWSKLWIHVARFKKRHNRCKSW